MCHCLLGGIDKLLDRVVEVASDALVIPDKVHVLSIFVKLFFPLVREVNKTVVFLLGVCLRLGVCFVVVALVIFKVFELAFDPEFLKHFPIVFFSLAFLHSLFQFCLSFVLTLKLVGPMLLLAWV